MENVETGLDTFSKLTQWSISEIGRQLAEFLVQVIMYNAAISACGRCNQWLYALNLLADMEALKVLPSSVTMTLGLSLSIEGNLFRQV